MNEQEQAELARQLMERFRNSHPDLTVSAEPTGLRIALYYFDALIYYRDGMAVDEYSVYLREWLNWIARQEIILTELANEYVPDEEG